MTQGLIEKARNIKRLHWCLALFVIPIVGLGQYCLRWRQFDIHDSTVSRSGRVFAAVSSKRPRTNQIWEWSSDLSDPQVVLQYNEPIHRLASNRKGDVLVGLAYDSLVAFDTRSQRVLWIVDVRHNHWKTDLLFSPDDRYVITVELADVNSESTFNIRSVDDGRLIGTKMDRVASQVRWNANRIVYFTLDNEFVTIELSDQQISELSRSLISATSIQHLRPLARLRRRSGTKRKITGLDFLPGSAIFVESYRRHYESRSRIQLVDYQSDVVLKQVWPTKTSKTLTMRLVQLVSIASGIWIWLLIRDGSASADPSRCVIDLCLVMILIHSLCIHRVSPVDFEISARSLRSAIVAVWAAMMTCVLFVGAVNVKQPKYVYGFVLLGSLNAVFTPMIGLALILRAYKLRFGWGQSTFLSNAVLSGAAVLSNPKWQFGLRDVMLATTAVAVFIATGLGTVVFMPHGFAIGFLLVLSLVISRWRTIAFATVLLCAVGVTASCCGKTVAWNEHEAQIFMMTIPFLFCFVKMYGHGLAKVAVEAEADC